MTVPSPATSTGRRFRLLRTLGEGTFGSVYLAEMSSMGGFKRQVALKLLNPNWDPESDAGRRLRDEARLLGRLQHRHVVRVDDMIRVGGRWALVMEFISGADLEAIISVAQENKARLPVRVCVEIAVATAEALYAAYNASSDDGTPLKVVHRDIKPSNILLSETGDIKVLDFGVARAEFAGREAKTERVRYGSLGYMSPERVLGGDETAAGDVYALGVVLYELLTLHTLGRAELAEAQHARKLSQVRIYMSSANIDEDIGDIVAQCLAYDPEARPDSETVARLLREVLRRLTGDDVTTFARAFVPTVRERIAATTAEPTEQEIREDLTESITPHQTQSRSDASTVNIETPPSNTFKMRWPFMVAAALSAMVVVALGVVFLPNTVQTDPAVLATSPPVVPQGVPQAVPTVAPIPQAVPQAVPQVVPPVVSPVVPVAPAPQPQPTPTVAPPPSPTKRTETPTPTATKPVESPQPTPAPDPVATSDVPLLRAVKVTLSGGTGLNVRCGSVKASGESNVLLKDVPAGKCSVSSGASTTNFTITEPRGVACTLDGETLSCH